MADPTESDTPPAVTSTILSRTTTRKGPDEYVHRHPHPAGATRTGLAGSVATASLRTLATRETRHRGTRCAHRWLMAGDRHSLGRSGDRVDRPLRRGLRAGPLG